MFGKFFLSLVCFVVFLSSLFGAAPQKSCVSIDEIINKSTADEEFFKTLMDRLQTAITKTGKFDVVDKTTLHKIVEELEKQEEGISLSDENLVLNPKLAVISIHGTILSMILESKDYIIDNQKYCKIVGTMELKIGFYDLRTGAVFGDNEQQVKISKFIVTQQKSTVKDNSGKKKFTKIIEPEKEVIDSKTGKKTVIPAKTETYYFTPSEEKIYNDVMQGAVDKIVEKLMENAYPLSVIGASDGKVYINMPEERSRDKMAAGTTFEILQLGEGFIDPDTLESIGSEEKRIMVVSIQTVRPKMAIAVPVSGKENFNLLSQEMKKYSDKLKLAKNVKELKKIKSPFAVRQIEGNTIEVVRQPKETNPTTKPSGIDDRFSH